MVAVGTIPVIVLFAVCSLFSCVYALPGKHLAYKQKSGKSVIPSTQVRPFEIGTLRYTVDGSYKRNSFFHGIIDEVRISNTARYTEDFTPEERFEPDEHTLALYHFDEGSGDVLKDSSGNGHDGKIVGAKWVKVDDELQVVQDPG